MIAGISSAALPTLLPSSILSENDSPYVVRCAGRGSIIWLNISSEGQEKASQESVSEGKRKGVVSSEIEGMKVKLFLKTNTAQILSYLTSTIGIYKKGQ